MGAHCGHSRREGPQAGTGKPVFRRRQRSGRDVSLARVRVVAVGMDELNRHG